MGYYINAEVGYYEGDQISPLDQVVPQRPDAQHAWNGTAWAPIPLTLAQQAAALLAGTVTITSASTPALNGSYAIDDTVQAHINAVVTNILLNGTFPGGSAQYVWPDASGALHVFPSTDEFKLFATALAGFVAACIGCQTGALSALPSSNLSIA